MNNPFLDLSGDRESTFEPIPAGVYNLVVTGAEEALTQKGDKRIKITFAVADGDYAGRKIFEGYNLSGNPKSVEIGRGQLKSLWKCAGNNEFVINSVEQFLNIEIAASVKIKTDETYGDKNVISSFKPKKQVTATAAPPF